MRIERVKQILRENTGRPVKEVILESMNDPLFLGHSIILINSYFFDLLVEEFFHVDQDGLQITKDK